MLVGTSKCLTFTGGNEMFPIGPKCQLEQASPQHILDWIRKICMIERESTRSIRLHSSQR
ncbi:hypothetical protein TNIN_223831, partial [Trichonephila inaurata madagascariensis]